MFVAPRKHCCAQLRDDCHGCSASGLQRLEATASEAQEDMELHCCGYIKLVWKIKSTMQHERRPCRRSGKEAVAPRLLQSFQENSLTSSRQHAPTVRQKAYTLRGRWSCPATRARRSGFKTLVVTICVGRRKLQSLHWQPYIPTRPWFQILWLRPFLCWLLLCSLDSFKGSEGKLHYLLSESMDNSWTRHRFEIHSDIANIKFSESTGVDAFAGLSL